MNVLDKLYAKAKANPQRVAFPEAENEKMMQAAYETGKDGYIIPVLIGNATRIKELSNKKNYDSNIFEIIDIDDEAYKNNIIDKYVHKEGTFLKEKALGRRMQNPLYYAMAMQAVDDVAVTFAGIDNPTSDVLLAGQMMIGLKEGVDTISSIAICQIPGFKGSEDDLIVFGDSAVCTNPTSHQLAQIAIGACEEAQVLLDWQPRCAMLSYSTLGSGQGELVDKVKEAVKIANELRPDLAIEGEYQFDSAVSLEVAKKKVPGESKVAGKANILIWPDLNVGNISVKIIQQLTGADAYGPILQGFNKVICDCSRGAPISEIKGNIIISAVRASGLKNESI